MDELRIQFEKIMREAENCSEPTLRFNSERYELDTMECSYQGFILGCRYRQSLDARLCNEQAKFNSSKLLNDMAKLIEETP